MKFYRNLTDELESVVIIQASAYLYTLLFEHFKQENCLSDKEYDEMVGKVINKYFKK